MMNLPLSIATKLIDMLEGHKVPYSRLKHPAIDAMIDNGILDKQILGRSKALVFLRNKFALATYLNNHFGIGNLEAYIEGLYRVDLTRSEAIEISSNSKVKSIRSFKGFLVNCFHPIECILNGATITVNPQDGTFVFVYDFENFQPPTDTTIVGIENPENFRYIKKQRNLFTNISPLFVSRYPQTKDLIRWLKSIPNDYLHFGDFDFAGINIYWNEYKKHLKDRAKLFTPPRIEELIALRGRRANYENQTLCIDETSVDEEGIKLLLNYIRTHKKGLEQEFLINQSTMPLP